MKALMLHNLVALVACGALGTWAYQEAQRPPIPLPETPKAAAVAASASAPESTGPATPEEIFRLPPKNAFSQLAARPPFSQSRRPPRPKPGPTPVAVQVTAPAPAPPPIAEPQVTLVGILINSEKSIAMVRKPGVEELLRLAKGASLDGWRVEGVLPDRLLLSHGDKLLELELTEADQRSNSGGTVERAPVRARRQ